MGLATRAVHARQFSLPSYVLQHIAREGVDERYNRTIFHDIPPRYRGVSDQHLGHEAGSGGRAMTWGAEMRPHGPAVQAAKDPARSAYGSRALTAGTAGGSSEASSPSGPVLNGGKLVSTA